MPNVNPLLLRMQYAGAPLGEAPQTYFDLTNAGAAGLLDYMKDPWSSGYFNQRQAQAQQQIGDLQSSARDRLATQQNIAGYARTPAFIEQQQRALDMQTSGMKSNALLTNMLQAESNRRDAITQSMNWRPLQTGQEAFPPQKSNSWLGPLISILGGLGIGALDNLKATTPGTSPSVQLPKTDTYGNPLPPVIIPGVSTSLPPYTPPIISGGSPGFPGETPSVTSSVSYPGIGGTALGATLPSSFVGGSGAYAGGTLAGLPAYMPSVTSAAQLGAAPAIGAGLAAGGAGALAPFDFGAAAMAAGGTPTVAGTTAAAGGGGTLSTLGALATNPITIGVAAVLGTAYLIKRLTGSDHLVADQIVPTQNQVTATLQDLATQVSTAQANGTATPELLAQAAQAANEALNSFEAFTYKFSGDAARQARNGSNSPLVWGRQMLNSWAPGTWSPGATENSLLTNDYSTDYSFIEP